MSGVYYLFQYHLLSCSSELVHYVNRRVCFTSSISSGLPVCFPSTSDNFTHSCHSSFAVILQRKSFITMFIPLISLPTSAVRLVPIPNVAPIRDRKSTRLNSSHVRISYAVFCSK